MSIITSKIKPYLSVNTSLEINILFLIAGIGVITKLFLNNLYPVMSTLWGYGLSASSLFFIIMIGVGLDYNNDQKSFFKKFFENSFPILLLILILVWIISLNYKYKKIIEKKKVPDEYNTYSLLSTIIMLLQISILYMFLKDKLNLTILDNFLKNTIPLSDEVNKNSKKNKLETDRMRGINYIFTLINAILVGMMQVVLTFFTTDG